MLDRILTIRKIEQSKAIHQAFTVKTVQASEPRVLVGSSITGDKTYTPPKLLLTKQCTLSSVMAVQSDSTVTWTYKWRNR